MFVVLEAIEIYVFFWHFLIVRQPWSQPCENTPKPGFSGGFGRGRISINFYAGLDGFGKQQTSWNGILQKRSQSNRFAWYSKSDYTPAAILNAILNNLKQKNIGQ